MKHKLLLCIFPTSSLSLLTKEVSGFAWSIAVCSGPLAFCSTESGEEGGMKDKRDQSQGLGRVKRGRGFWREVGSICSMWENGWERKGLQKEKCLSEWSLFRMSKHSNLFKNLHGNFLVCKSLFLWSWSCFETGSWGPHFNEVAWVSTLVSSWRWH